MTDESLVSEFQSNEDSREHLNQKDPVDRGLETSAHSLNTTSLWYFVQAACLQPASKE